MKKLSIMAVIICAAMFANAAAFSWKLQTGAGYTGFNVYAVSGTTASALLAIFESSDSTVWSTPLEGVEAFSVVGTNARAGATGENVGINAADNLVFVMIGGEVKEGTQYWVVNDYSIPAENVYEPPASGDIVTINMATQGVAGTGTFISVPEPASAMLALAGVAMLIRRRK